MLELPHPLLADSIHVERAARWPVLLYKEDRSPGEYHHGNAKRHRRPEDFQRNRAFDLVRDRMLVVPVLDAEDENQNSDKHRKEDRNPEDEKVERVHMERQP